MTYRLIAIGASLGGLNALRQVLGSLPQDFTLPVAVAQHRSASTGDALQLLLQEVCPLPVTEAEDKSAIEPGRIYLAPADYHLLVEHEHFALESADPEALPRPSVDALFETAARSFGKRLVAVVLTGTGEDGARGLAAVVRAGGLAIVQTPQGARAPGMPQAAVEREREALQLPLGEIGPRLAALARA